MSYFKKKYSFVRLLSLDLKPNEKATMDSNAQPIFLGNVFSFKNPYVALKV